MREFQWLHKLLRGADAVDPSASIRWSAYCRISLGRADVLMLCRGLSIEYYTCTVVQTAGVSRVRGCSEQVCCQSMGGL